jgi:V/A-type H+-transporting ATPase subunit A
VTKSIREDFLYQSAFDPVDQYTTLEKQYRLLRLIVTLYKEGLSALEAGVELEKIKTLQAIPAIARARLIPEEKAKEEIQAIEDSIKEELLTLKGAMK